MKVRLVAFLLLSLFAILPQSALAQYGRFWEKIGQIPPENGNPVHVTCGYFWSKDEGVIGVEDMCPNQNDCGFSQLYYRENGKWIKSTYPPYDLGGPRQIVMKDRDTGYAVFEARYVGGELGSMKTTDGGRTWTIFRVFGEASDAVITEGGELLYTHFGFGPQLGKGDHTIRGNSITHAEGMWITVDRDHLRFSYDDGTNWGIWTCPDLLDTCRCCESGIRVIYNRLHSERWFARKIQAQRVSS